MTPGRKSGLGFLLTAALLLCLITPVCRAETSAPIAGEAAIKATYLYKFPPYVTWPDDAFASSDSAFNLCIVGGDPFGAGLDRAVKGLSIVGHPISIHRLPMLSPEDVCQVLYIATRDQDTARQTLAIVDGRPVLTITDFHGNSAPTGIINFIVADHRVGFAIDDSKAMKSGLAISSKLLSIASLIGSKSP